MFKFTNKMKSSIIFKKSLLALFFLSIHFFNANAQNVGIGTTTPSTTLHVVKPAGVLDPLRIEGLRLTNIVSNILMVDTTNGIVKRISFDSLVNLVRDSLYTDDQLLTLSNDTLYIEDGNWVVIQHPSDTNLIDSLILLKADTLFNLLKDSLYVYISDSLLKDTLWVNTLDSLLITRKDTLYFNDTTYTIVRDSLLGDTIFIDSVYKIISDSLLKDSLWIIKLDSLLGSIKDTLYFNDTTYKIIRDSLLGDTIFLDSLRNLLPDKVNDADSVVGNEYNTNFYLSNDTLYIVDGGGSRFVKLGTLLTGGTKPITRVVLTGNSSHQILISDGDITFTSAGNITDTLFLPDASINQYYELSITPYGNGLGTNGLFIYTTAGERIITACSTSSVRLRLWGNSTTGSCVHRSVRLKSDGTDWIVMHNFDR